MEFLPLSFNKDAIVKSVVVKKVPKAYSSYMSARNGAYGRWLILCSNIDMIKTQVAFEGPTSFVTNVNADANALSYFNFTLKYTMDFLDAAVGVANITYTNVFGTYNAANPITVSMVGSLLKVLEDLRELIESNGEFDITSFDDTTISSNYLSIATGLVTFMGYYF